MDIKSLPLAELRRRLLDNDELPSRRVLAALAKDPRAGAREIHRRLRQRVQRARTEAKRFEALFHHERDLRQRGAARIAGVDEAGMGPLAGPVVAAAVVFDPGARIDGVDDSKLLDPDTRETLALRIHDLALGVGVGIAEVPEIDRLNIYHAGLLAMSRAVAALPEPADAVLVDARTIPDLEAPQLAVAGGDRSSFTIACASIIAKTHRDRLMQDLDGRYPGYGFAGHKGYATPEHREALVRLGPCPAHRASWGYVRDVCGELDGEYYEARLMIEAAIDDTTLSQAAERVDALRQRLAAAEYRRLRQLLARRRRQLRQP